MKYFSSLCIVVAALAALSGCAGTKHPTSPTTSPTTLQLVITEKGEKTKLQVTEMWPRWAYRAFDKKDVSTHTYPRCKEGICPLKLTVADGTVVNVHLANFTGEQQLISSVSIDHCARATSCVETREQVICTVALQ